MRVIWKLCTDDPDDYQMENTPEELAAIAKEMAAIQAAGYHAWTSPRGYRHDMPREKYFQLLREQGFSNSVS